MFPHSRALDEGGLEEERRLAYVGVTRAERQLTITSARRRNVFGAQNYGMKSRFIDEIPDELTDREEPTIRSARGGLAGTWASAAAGTQAASYLGWRARITTRAPRTARTTPANGAITVPISGIAIAFPEYFANI